MFKPGEVISYWEMCHNEGMSLQRGMYFRPRSQVSILLMSVRAGAPYADRIEDDGRALIYEGHDAPHLPGVNPKTLDQPLEDEEGNPTQNGLFYRAATDFENKVCGAKIVKVYEKLRSGIWVYNGIFRLIDAWTEESNGRTVIKFKLELIPETERAEQKELEHNRLIPSAVKVAVWKRDKGKCVVCGSKDNLHFDHIIPYSKGGSSLVADNIQLMCARHNLAKHDKIE